MATVGIKGLMSWLV